MGPFSKPLVLVADIGETRDIMMRSEFDRSVYIIDRFPLFRGSQIRMHTGEDWRTSRGWLKDLLTPQYMQTVAGPAIHSSVRQLIELWELSSRLAGPGRPFSMLEDLKILALDVMTQFHHGNEFQDLAIKRQIQHIQQLEPDSSKLAVGPNNGVTFPRAPMNVFGQGVMEIGDRMAAIYVMSSPPGLVSWWTQYIIPRYRKFFAATRSVIRRRIDIAIKRLHQGEEAKTGIDHMVYREEKAAIKAGRQPLYEDQIMVDEVRNHALFIIPFSSCPCPHLLFNVSSSSHPPPHGRYSKSTNLRSHNIQAFGNHIAGLHTTSASMVWILKYLTENQAVQGRLRAELQNAFPAAVQEDNRLPTSAELMKANLPYVEAVIEETLRLRAAFLIARDAVRDTELLGYRIPKGTVCLLVCQGLEHFSSLPSKSAKPARQYPGNGNPDLEVFDPERWLVRNDGEVRFDGSSNSQMAFGLGIRACWGRKLAELEMKTMTAMVAWSFDILGVPKALASHDGLYDFSYRAKRGFLRLRRREGASDGISMLMS